MNSQLVLNEALLRQGAKYDIAVLAIATAIVLVSLCFSEAHKIQNAAVATHEASANLLRDVVPIENAVLPDVLEVLINSPEKLTIGQYREALERAEKICDGYRSGLHEMIGLSHFKGSGFCPVSHDYYKVLTGTD